jgi:DNA-binding winged helix-turn-helix (wHTH) protein
MTTSDLLSFGPYLLDTHARRLTRDGADVRLAARQLELLCLLASRPGEVLAKDALIQHAWDGLAVTNGSLDNAIYALRRGLPMPTGEPLIETQARRGVRFVARVTRVSRRNSDSSVNEVLALHRAWMDGRAALETLDQAAISKARAAFETVVAQAPGQAPAHVGLANACALQFEMTRTDVAPDVAAIQRALPHAREACRLDATYGEAWATLGFVLERAGFRDEALAAARQSIVVEPDNWRHHLRLGAASWGEERLREARRTLRLLPGLAMAHWLAASVLVARQAVAEADAELVAGLADAPTPAHDGDEGHARFSGIALHWLRGLIALAAGDTTRAHDLFARELQQEHGGHLYARECAANTWYAIGAMQWRRGEAGQARAAFQEALRRVPAHPMARAALGLDFPSRPTLSPVDAAIASIIAGVSRGEDLGGDAGTGRIERALIESPPGNAGWWLPVEPMLHISSRPEPWRGVLERLRSRAA